MFSAGINVQTKQEFVEYKVSTEAHANYIWILLHGKVFPTPSPPIISYGKVLSLLGLRRGINSPDSRPAGKCVHG